MEDARINQDEDADNDEPLEMTLEHIEISLRAVTDTVFPFLALEVLKQWVMRNVEKQNQPGCKNTEAVGDAKC
jgi:hypothetical protein